MSSIIILLLGALLVSLKLTSWGVVIAISSLKYFADMLFIETGKFMALIQKNITSAKRVFEIIDTPLEEDEALSNYKIKKNKYPISLKNISFAYNDAYVINNLSLNFAKNKLNIIKGKSGCGKSTLIKLLLGFYTIDNGNIIFDGSTATTIKNIRSLSAYVPQETQLFGNSIYDNIAFSNTDADYQSVVKYAKQAGIHEYIMSLTDGYDTKVLDDGVSLSGGEKQRILIARALLKNTDILLLDEITSALDSKIENLVMETIKNISRYKTVIFITHKQEIINWADRVYILR